MKSRKQIISEAVLNELTGLGAFVTPDYMAREALYKGWLNPRIDDGYRITTGYTPDAVMGGFREHGSVINPEDPIAAYMVANARNRAKLRKQFEVARGNPEEEERIAQIMDRRYAGLHRIMKRALAIDPTTTRNLGAFAGSADRMYAKHYPNDL